MTTSQENKTVSFRLSGGGPTISLTLPINPDEVQLEHPARVTTTQTLGGIYQDVDDLGVQSLTLHGNTGWRTKKQTGMDGLQAAQFLYKEIYKGYYSRLKASKNVQLLLINNVDGYTYKVSMTDFQMMRSKSGPLLFLYTAYITALQDISMATPSPTDSVQKEASNVTKMLSSGITTGMIRQTSKVKTYKVVNGDTLTGISLKFYGSTAYVNQLAQANHITNPRLIYINQILVIPSI